MATSHPVALKNEVVDLITGKLNLGSTNPQGRFVFLDSGDVVLASLDLSNPAFAASVNGQAAVNTVTTDTSADATGTAVSFEFRDRDDAAVWGGSVTGTGGGGDVELTNVSLAVGDQVALPNYTYTFDTPTLV